MWLLKIKDLSYCNTERTPPTCRSHGDPEETVGKKPPLFATFSDPVEDETESAAVDDDSLTLDAETAEDPVSAVAAPSLESGLIMMLNHPGERPPRKVERYRGLPGPH